MVSIDQFQRNMHSDHLDMLSQKCSSNIWQRKRGGGAGKKGNRRGDGEKREGNRVSAINILEHHGGLTACFVDSDAG